jgi:hypothetical protein
MKAIKILICSFILSASTTIVIAQKFTVGVRGGLNVSNVKYNAVIDTANAQFNVDSYNSFLAGVTLNFESKKKFIYGIEVNAMNKGFENRVTYSSSSNQVSTSYPEDRNIKSVTIPCYFGKKFGGKIFIGLTVGLAPTYIYKAESDSVYTISGTTDIKVATNDIIDDLNKFTLEGCGTVFLGVKLFDRFMIQGDLRYQQAFNDLYKDGEFQDKYFGKTSSVSGALVFRYILFKKGSVAPTLK